MLYPAPTTRLAHSIARGTLVEHNPASAMALEAVVIAFPNTSYKLSFVPVGSVEVQVGKRIEGEIHAEARRVDVSSGGGRFVDPVFGMPQRLQGSVVGLSEAEGTITVNAGVPFVCTLGDRRQSVGNFALGDLVTFDITPGATFTPRLV